VRSGANPERDLMRRELGRKIGTALSALTPRERMVFELKHYHGLKLRTVGEMLNTTEETAKEHFVSRDAEIARVAGGDAMSFALVSREGDTNMKCDWVRQNILFYVYNELEDDLATRSNSIWDGARECGARS